MLKEQTRQSLRMLFDKRQVVTDPVELVTYEIDAGLNRGAPDGVVFPKTPDQVAQVVRWAAEHRVPLVARSAGTGLSGGAVPSQGGVVVSFSRMTDVLEIDEQDRLAVVQPGLINLALDALVKSRGLYYPPDPASQRACSIGGNIAENAGGPHCFKYGVTTNYINDLRVVLADGQLVHTGGRACDYPAYDFTGLLTGSEGTLGLVAEATLRLVRNAPGVKTCTATFDSVEAAGLAVSAIIAAGLIPAALEMMDRNIIGIIEDYVHAGLPTDAAALLLLEVDGYPESLDAQIQEIVEVLNRQAALKIRVYTPAEREQIWTARKSAFGAMARLSPAYFQVDGTVPRSRLSETLAEINRMCASRGLKVGFVFHAGDGNLHPLIPFDPTDAEMTTRVYEVGDEFLKLAVSLDGAITGEHGVGLEKRKFMPLMYSADELAAMRDVKKVFDPDGIFNPGKVFPEQQAAGSEQLTVNSEQSTVNSRFELRSPFVPDSEEQAADGLRAAQAAGRQVVIRGGGTLSAPPLSDALVLSTEKLCGVVTLARDDLYVTVKSGTRLDDLQALLAADKLCVPLATPWAESTIGGIVASGFNSPQRMRYGAVRDQVLGLRVVLPDGRRMRFGRPVVKNVAGYDMPKLFVGAHGTLGLITEVTLRLTALPRTRRTLFIPIDDLERGLACAGRVLPLALVASAVVLRKGAGVQGSRGEPVIARSGFGGGEVGSARSRRSKAIPNWALGIASQKPLAMTDAPYLLVYTAEGYPQDVEAELRAVGETLSALGVDNIAESESESGFDLWADLLRRQRSHLRVGVPRKSLPAFLIENAAALGDDYVADMANGLFYVPFMGDLKQLALRQSALALGGYTVVTAARRDGEFDPWGYRPETLPLMRRLKARWDPVGYFNPGMFLV